MTNQLNEILQKHIRIINHTKAPTIFSKDNNAMASFAIDDAIATTVSNKTAPPTFRLWVHEPTIVLGIPDGRLPFLQEGIAYLKDASFKAIIRNSGGLAVALDEHVVNLSMIIPDAKHVSINDGYDMMYFFIQQLLAAWTNDIRAYEIVGSYCPGDYDLSIHGRKFAGISQRRIRDGVAVQIYLDVCGDSHKRAAIVRDFYKRSKQNTATSYTYPEVNPAVMGSLNELLQTNFTTESFIKLVEDTLTKQTSNLSHTLLAEEEPLFHKRYEQMEKRNEKLMQAFES